MSDLIGVVVATVLGLYLLALLIGALKGFTLREVLWVLGDSRRDPMKWLRRRDEQGHLRPTARKGPGDD